MFCHYFSSKKSTYIIISETNRPIGKKMVVSGKIEAKKLAKALNLKQWNF
jgi:hypothetical protein